MQCSHSINHKLQNSARFLSIQCQAPSQPWKNKNKTHYLQATKHLKNRIHNKWRITTPSMPRDDQLSLALAFSPSPNPYSSSSIRLLFHPNFHLDLVHIEKKQTHFQVTVTSMIIPSPSWVRLVSVKVKHHGCAKHSQNKGRKESCSEFGLTFWECPPPVGFTYFIHCKPWQRHYREPKHI